MSAPRMLAAGLLAGMLASGTGHAQTAKRAAASCDAGDARSAWLKEQRAWMRDSIAPTDTMRSALAAAVAGLLPVEESAIPPQLGAHVVDSATIAGPTAQATAASSEMVARLTKMARDRQSRWPTKSVAGAAGVRAMYRLAQTDTAFAKIALHRLMEAGPDESFAPDVAALEDEIRLRGGRKQLYATQLHADASGKIVPYPTEDLAHVDLRREGASLPPLARSLCEARAANR